MFLFSSRFSEGFTLLAEEREEEKPCHTDCQPQGNVGLVLRYGLNLEPQIQALLDLAAEKLLALSPPLLVVPTPPSLSSPNLQVDQTHSNPLTPAAVRAACDLSPAAVSQLQV